MLDSLVTAGIPTAVLLRPTSNSRWLEPHLGYVETRSGSISDPTSLDAALKGVTHVIHCAGCTKAASIREFYSVNQTGTANVVSAANAARIHRLVQVSSLAAAGPATSERPAKEEDPPHPVSEYGKSKLAGEAAVTSRCEVDYVIVRPPAVYGPRDTGFLPLFRAVRSHVRPRPARQPLSFVYAPDLAQVIVACLQRPEASKRTYYAASSEIASGRMMADEIVHQTGQWTVPLPLNPAVFWPICVVNEVWSRCSGKACMLSLQKMAELRAPGWVCDSSRLKKELGITCETNLARGLSQTIRWYRDNRWL